MRSSLEINLIAPALLDVEELLPLWNAAQPDDRPASVRLFQWWQAAHASGDATGIALLLRDAGSLAGVALVSAPMLPTDGSEDPLIGWIDGLAAPAGPKRRRRRAQLLAAAETWLGGVGAGAVALGGGPQSLIRGFASDERTLRFLRAMGYVECSPTPVHDLALDVARYQPPSDLPPLPGVVRPAQPRDRDEVEALLAGPLESAATGDAASMAQRFGIRRLLREGRLGDLMLLWTDDGVSGMAQLAFADSQWPVEVTYPWALPRSWAALPMVLVRAGQPDGAHLALIDASVRRLHNNGINSCVAPGITWTSIYHRAGFVPFQQWRPFVKRLA